MKLRHVIYYALGVFAICAALSVPPAPSYAGQALLCAPDPAGVATGPGRYVNPTTGNAYSTNGAGCAVIALTDVGYFRAQGWTFGPNTLSIVYDTGVQTGTTDLIVGSIPPGAYIRDIFVENTTATAITGGIAFSTTGSGATDIVTALTCGASCLTFVADSALKLRVFSTTASQAIHAAAVTSWQNARAKITVIYGYF